MKKFRNTLVVDDDPISRFLTKLTLEDLQITEAVLEFDNGQQALDYLKQHCIDQYTTEDCPDWIILDLNMPIMNGLELLAQLEALQQHALIEKSVTILTSSNNETDRNTTAQFGVNGYITKPLLEEELLQLVNRF